MGISDFLNNINSQNNKNEEKIKKNIEKSFEKYKDMTENDLMSQLLNEANKQKQRGNFDYEKLKSAVDRMSSFLPEEHVKKLRQLLEQLK